MPKLCRPLRQPKDEVAEISAMTYKYRSVITTCANCGVETSTPFQVCSQCKLPKYCGRDCQVKHWKEEHKTECKKYIAYMSDSQNREHMRNNYFTSEDEAPIKNVPTNLHKQHMSNIDDLVNEAQSAKREGRILYPVVGTAQGEVIMNRSQEDLPEGVPSGIFLKEEAHANFITGYPENMNYERSYRAFLDDLIDHDKEWKVFLDHPLNFDHAEHSAGLMGTLATIYRQNGDYVNCEKALKLAIKILRQYKASIGKEGSLADEHCHDRMEYKISATADNLYRQTNRFEKCVPFYRKLLAFELNNNIEFGDQRYLFTVTWIHKQPTPDVIASLSKKEILRIINVTRSAELATQR